MGIIMTMKKIIATENAPGAIGPYSQAVETDGMIFTSGQLGMDPSTGELKTGIEAQTAAALDNLKAILESEGLSLENVVKTMVFISDMDKFSAVNEVYKTYFTGSFPARSCIEAARLPKNALVEIEAVAVR